MRRLFLALAAAATLAAGQAASDVIIDTGVVMPFFGGIVVGGDIAVAGRFDVSRPTILTDVEGYLGFATPGDTLTFALLADAGGPGVELFASPFAVSLPEGWQGLHGLSWTVPAGAYWLAFETRGGQTFNGALGIPVTPTLTASRLPPLFPDYTVIPLGAGGIAFRINGVAAAIPETGVPEPAAWALMIVGFGAAGVALRRRVARAA
jgi:hypothetical protein